jgi:uncharacterized protein YgiM (DUF1202 family)
MTKIILSLIFTICSVQAFAQDLTNKEKDKQYVTDQLRLSLYQDANSKSKVLKLLQSGDAVFIEEIRGPYALVTTPAGTRGWVKRGFLVTNPTSNLLLREEREKNASLFDEIEKLSNSKTIVEAYEQDMDKMTSNMEQMQIEKQQADDTISRLQQELLDKQLEIDQKLEMDLKRANNEPSIEILWETLRHYWKIIVPFLLALLLLCSLISKKLVESRIKARFHGIKIW